MRWTAALSFVSLLLASPAAAAREPFALKQGKIAISSPDGLNDASYTLDPSQRLPPIHLAEQTTFKLSFTVIDPSSGEGVSPKQAHLLFEDTQAEEDVTMSIGVKANGRASFTLNTAKLPTALQHTSGLSNLTLFLSSPSPPGPKPLAYPITSLTLAPGLLKPVPAGRYALPPRAGEPAFTKQEDLFHTFKKEDKNVNIVISLIGLGITLTPWFALLALISNLRPSLNFSSPSPMSSLFLLSLIALELLIAVYWVGLKLYQLIPAFLGLAGVSAYIGKMALAGLREKRVKSL